MATPFQDPLLSYQYSIEMAGGANTLATAWFTEISGIGAEQEIIEYKYYEKLPSDINITKNSPLPPPRWAGLGQGIG